MKTKLSRKINIFSSITFYSIILTLFLALAPELSRIADDKKLKASDFINLLAILASSGLSIIATYSENSSIYTPHSLPGRSKEDIN